MGQLSPIHWLIVLAIIVLLFGWKKIPDVMRELGEGIYSFKDDMDGRRRPGGGPQHPIPVTGPVETQKARKDSPENEDPGQRPKAA